MNAILQWLYNNTPSFLRPAVNWLIHGLRGIILVIVGAWNWLGVSVSRWHTGVVAWATHASEFTRTAYTAFLFFKNVIIPHAISVARNAILNTVNALNTTLRSVISAGLSTLQHWAQAAINAVSAVTNAVSSFATYWIDRIRSTVDALIDMLQPILHGPARLAEWIIGPLISAAGRYALGQGERIARWLLSSSPTFSMWLAREIELILSRVLR